MEISHECPLSIVKESRKFNDYDYALVHLFEEIPGYFGFFQDSLVMGRKVLLDNSIFELEEAFDADKFAEWIQALRPTEYIIPDALENTTKTLDQCHEWMRKYSDLPGIKIGVVQGKTLREIVDCYQILDTVYNVDKIAISFDYSYYEETCPHPNKWYSWAMGRATLLGRLLRMGVINQDKPHHLLGCGVPMEGMFYQSEDFKWIESMDTSNPVVHAIKGIRYREGWGLDYKESQKLFTLINTPVEEIDPLILNHNLTIFRKLWNGAN